MSTEILEPPMSDDKSKTLSVKLHLDVIKSARIIASYRDATMTDLLSDILRPILAEMEQLEVSRRAKAQRDSETAGDVFAPGPRKKRRSK